MNIKIRYFKRTSLEKKAFEKVIRKYAKLKYDILIVFDLRIKCFGTHAWNDKKRCHIIRISPTKCKIHIDEDNLSGVRLGPAAEKYRIISTLLHELRHAQQKEELGSRYYNEKYDSIEEITNPQVASWYSECERDARIFEDKNIESAVELYDLSCEE